jgi:hypothetical protein
VQRQADEWAWGLRRSPLDSLPTLLSKEKPHPLQRLILCDNALKDQGCDLLLDLLRDNVGMLGTFELKKSN